MANETTSSVLDGLIKPSDPKLTCEKSETVTFQGDQIHTSVLSFDKTNIKQMY